MHPRRWHILMALSVALCTVNIGTLALNIGLPSIGVAMQATTSQLQWITETYVLALAALMITMGSLADRFGRRRLLVAGLLLYGVASVGGALCHAPWQLIAVRAVLGAAGAMIMPATLSIVRSVFPPEEMVKAMAVWTGVVSAGVMLGPIAGGVLVEAWGWPALFWMNVPLVAGSLLAVALVVPESRAAGRRPLDPLGMVLGAASTTALVYAVIQAPHAGWLSARTLGTLAGGAAGFVLFLWWERRTAYPMLDLTLFHNPRFWAASVAVTIAYFALMGTAFLLTLYMQTVQGHSPVGSALRLTPMAVAAGLSAAAAEPLVHRFGTRDVVAGGLAVTTLGMLVFSTVGWHNNEPVVLAGLGVLTLGLVAAGIAASESIMSSVSEDQAGSAAAVDETSIELGGTLGVAVMGSVYAAGFAAGLTSAVRSLPAELRKVATESISGAIEAADRVGGPLGADFAATARASFLDGTQTAAWIGAGVAFVGALLTVRFLPGRDSAR
ncbi:EmrB/QacA subfamily drug resistance transporter [Catenulispora sp. GAS73]|uniref:MFS transporter n=1 Tax=Catenulispora sp. GAS73 TaxID=3156269 RepID=UPI003513584B